VGYHGIRGLAAALRMMMAYKKQEYTNIGYGSDMAEAWFAKDKPELVKKNSMINLPYVLDGDVVVTQSISCSLYIGRKLAIDQDADFIHNHMVLDQTMDMRNDLMTIIYPGRGGCASKEVWPEAAKKHLAGATATHLTKLEGFCKGTYMCGAAPNSGDFQLFEMLDQHVHVAAAVHEPNLLDNFPKLKTMHATMKADPALATYFASPFYTELFHNNGLFAYFTGACDGAVYAATAREQVTY
jgi:glutathione S-transferase